MWTRNRALFATAMVAAAAALLSATDAAGKEAPAVQLPRTATAWPKDGSAILTSTHASTLTFHVTGADGKVTLDQVLGWDTEGAATLAASTGSGARAAQVTRWHHATRGNTSLASLPVDRSLDGAHVTIGDDDFRLDADDDRELSDAARAWVRSSFLNGGASGLGTAVPPALIPESGLRVGAPHSRKGSPVRAVFLALGLEPDAADVVDWERAEVIWNLERVDGAAPATVAHVAFEGSAPVTRARPVGSSEPLATTEDSRVEIEGRFALPLDGRLAGMSCTWSRTSRSQFVMDGETVRSGAAESRTWTVRADSDATPAPTTPESDAPRFDLSRLTATWRADQVVRLTRDRSDTMTFSLVRPDGEKVAVRATTEVTAARLLARCRQIDDAGRATSLHLFFESFSLVASEKPDAPAETDDCLVGAHVTVVDGKGDIAKHGKAKCTSAAGGWLHGRFVKPEQKGAWRLLVPALFPDRPLAVGASWAFPKERIEAIVPAFLDDSQQPDFDLEAASASVTLERVEGQGATAVAHIRIRAEIPLKATPASRGATPFEPGSVVRIEALYRAPLDGNVGAAAAELSVSLDAEMRSRGQKVSIEARLRDAWTSVAATDMPPLPVAEDEKPDDGDDEAK